MKSRFDNRDALVTMVRVAVIAGLYTALTLCLAPISYGGVQIRIAEALTLLAVFSRPMIAAVTLGCFLSNLIGMFLGVNILGFADVIFGTLATLVAAMLTYALRNVTIKRLPVLASLPPVIINAIVIGLELNIMLTGSYNTSVFLMNAAQVGAGQVASCVVLGLMLVSFVKNKSLKLERLFIGA